MLELPFRLQRSAILAVAWLAVAPAWTTQPVSAAPNGPARRTSAENSLRERVNGWTVGIAGGLLEGAPIRLAAEIARVVDSGDDLRVLPIVTRGPTDNITALLNLHGVDAAIINADALEEFKASVPDISQRITLLASLFPSELHIFVRPEIKSLSDLAGKKVNFNTTGTAAAYSGPIIFDRLGIKIDRQFVPHQSALEQMRTDDMAAVVFVTSKPVDAFMKGKWTEGFKLLDVPYDEKFADYYMPALLEPSDYPGLIGAGSRVQTLAVPTILVAYNWPRNSDRYRRVARLTDYLFDRIERLHAPGFHPKWKDVNLAARAGNLNRFGAAQAWLDRHASMAAAARETPDKQLVRLQAAGIVGNETAEQDRLFLEFLEWRRRRQ